MPEVVNFCPATGVGRFDAKLDGDELRVKVKLHIAGALEKDKQATFRSAFEPMVKQHWEGQYGFKCAKDTYPLTYRPVFSISYVDNFMDAHFVLNLVDGAGGTENVGRTTYFKVAKDHKGFAPTTAQLYTGSVQPINSSGDLLRDLKASFPLYVDMTGNQPSPHAGNQLRMLGRQLGSLAANHSVYVTAYGSQRTAKQQTVIGILQHCGLTNVTARTSAKVFSQSKSKATGSTSYVKVSLKGDIDTTNFDPTLQPLFTYPAAAVHEFGHMLGLMDEYSCLSKKGADKLLALNFISQSEQQQWEQHNPQSTAINSISENVDRGQKKFIKYCHSAGVLPPHYGMHTISVMSSGSQFEPCHFVTLWAAVVEMTKAAEGDWSIVPLGTGTG